MPILKDFKFHSPGSLPQAIKSLEEARSSLLLAGGTFAINYLKKSAKYPSDVISLKNIKELRGIKDLGKELWIGSMVTISELLETKAIHENFPSLYDACFKLATTPIRNMATIGGNIASRFYWVDLPGVLISLGAVLEIISGNKKTSCRLEDFFKEKPLQKTIISGIIMPKEKRDSFYFRHTRTSQDVDVPFLGLAFSCVNDNGKLNDSRLVVNTTLSFPVLLEKTAS
ncbi:MAG TPA: FAD binding domain-containing protein, partial [Candidatus Omnitrophota bacterium]|nr:FAD binding domain-containing protein [Candidatus Omnitrophota bacterium]